jgi:hypothetical protein
LLLTGWTSAGYSDHLIGDRRIAQNPLAADPTFTHTASGPVSGDTTATLVYGGDPIITTTATKTSLPGNCPITFPRCNLKSPGYTFKFVAVTLNVSLLPNTGLGAVVCDLLNGVLVVLGL